MSIFKAFPQAIAPHNPYIWRSTEGVWVMRGSTVLVADYETIALISRLEPGNTLKLYSGMLVKMIHAPCRLQPSRNSCHWTTPCCNFSPKGCNGHRFTSRMERSEIGSRYLCTMHTVSWSLYLIFTSLPAVKMCELPVFQRDNLRIIVQNINAWL